MISKTTIAFILLLSVVSGVALQPHYSIPLNYGWFGILACLFHCYLQCTSKVAVAWWNVKNFQSATTFISPKRILSAILLLTNIIILPVAVAESSSLVSALAVWTWLLGCILDFTDILYGGYNIIELEQTESGVSFKGLDLHITDCIQGRCSELELGKLRSKKKQLGLDDFHGEESSFPVSYFVLETEVADLVAFFFKNGRLLKGDLQNLTQKWWVPFEAFTGHIRFVSTISLVSAMMLSVVAVATITIVQQSFSYLELLALQLIAATAVVYAIMAGSLYYHPSGRRPLVSLCGWTLISIVLKLSWLVLAGTLPSVTGNSGLFEDFTWQRVVSLLKLFT